MPVIYTPLSGSDQPITLAGLNTRYQEFEDYILALGAASQTSIEATAGEGLGDRAPAYLDLSDGMIYQMDADAAGPKAGVIRGFVDGAVSSSATATLVISGIMDGFSGLTAWQPVYVAATAGTITQTRPDPTSGGAQVMIAEMGFATATDTVYVAPKKIQYQKRDAFADDDTLTVQHHGDARGYTRNVWAYITELESGAEAEGYSSSNQDEDVLLRDRSVATYTADQCSGGTASASNSANGAAANGFDNNDATNWGTSATTGWLKYDFGSSNEKVIRRYTIEDKDASNNSLAPNSWTFEGSNNDSDWTVLDTVTGETSWSASEKRTFDIVNTTAYRYYRVNVSANDGGASLRIGEVEMMEASTYTDGPDKLAQTFTLSGDTDIASVGLWLKKVGSPTGTCTVRIETLSSGDPSGTLADVNATQTFLESGLGTSYAEELVNFSTEFTLAAGSYAIVLSTDRSASETNYIAWGADGSTPSYSGGEMFNEVSSSWSAESKDAVFSVYEPGLSHPAKVSVDWWSSTYADVVNRYGDGAGVDLTTKTTFKCLRDAGFDDMTVVVELD